MLSPRDIEETPRELAKIRLLNDWRSIKDLGYIPSVDHCILKHFKYYVNLIKDYIKENLARYLQQLRRELKMEKLNIALIGCGGIANALLKVIRITSIPSHNGWYSILFYNF